MTATIRTQKKGDMIISQQWDKHNGHQVAVSRAIGENTSMRVELRTYGTLLQSARGYRYFLTKHSI